MKLKKLLALLIVFTVILIIGCSKQGTEDVISIEEEHPITVELTKVIKGNIESLVGYSGMIKPIQEIMVTPKQPGKVIKINFDLGQRVKAGQVLFQLDKKDILLQLNQAAAAVELADINLRKMAGSTYEQQMIQMKSALVSAEINFNDAKVNYENIKLLYEAGAESKFNHDRLYSQLKLAEQQYESAKDNYDLLEEKSYLENIELAQAQLDQAKAAYNIIQSSLNSMDVISPISGTVSARNLKVGEFISNATPAFVIIDDTSYTIDINVSESTIGKLQIGDEVKIYISSISDKTHTGIITATAPSADIQKQTYLVKITLESPSDLIKGGMFAEVKFITEKAEDCIVIPLSAVIEEEGKKYVFIADGDKVIKAAVATGIYNDKEVQIVDGLTVGDLIVIKGQNFLKDGSTITISNGQEVR